MHVSSFPATSRHGIERKVQPNALPAFLPLPCLLRFCHPISVLFDLFPSMFTDFYDLHLFSCLSVLTARCTRYCVPTFQPTQHTNGRLLRSGTKSAIDHIRGRQLSSSSCLLRRFSLNAGLFLHSLPSRPRFCSSSTRSHFSLEFLRLYSASRSLNPCCQLRLCRESLWPAAHLCSKAA